MKRVYVAKNPTEAHLVKGVLDGENISAVVKGEFLWGVRGEVPLIPETAPSVWVIEDSDYDRARELINAYELDARRTSVSDRGWKCSKCGEDNEPVFTDCWNCGQPRHVP